MLTDRRLDARGSGTLLSANGDFRLSKSESFAWQLVSTHTREPEDPGLSSQFRTVDTLTDDTTQLNDPSIPDSLKFDTITFDGDAYTVALDGESFWGHAYYVGLNHDSRNLWIDASYLERSPSFRADNGFESKNNQRSARPTHRI